MRLTYVFVIIADIIVMVLTAGPSWNTPSSTALLKTSSECTVITSLDASSTDGSSVTYSLESQDPNGNFVFGDNSGPPFDKQLRCTEASITASIYTVIVRATHAGGNNEHTDLTLTITFTDIVSGPTWTSGNSYTLDKVDCSVCDAVATLSATTSDSSSVTYSFLSESPSSGGFSVSGSTLSCTIGTITATSYTVIVRAENTGDKDTSDQTITVTVSDSSSGGPTWVTGTTHTLNKDDSNACSAVTTLSATASDCSTVTYSLPFSPAEFSVSGSTLSCDLTLITATSYTVDVRAQNSGNSMNTDQTLTINVTSGGSNSDSDSNNNDGNNNWIYGAGIGGGAAGIAAIVGVSYGIYQGKAGKTVNPDKNAVEPSDNSENISPKIENHGNKLTTEAETV